MQQADPSPSSGGIKPPQSRSGARPDGRTIRHVLLALLALLAIGGAGTVLLVSLATFPAIRLGEADSAKSVPQVIAQEPDPPPLAADSPEAGPLTPYSRIRLGDRMVLKRPVVVEGPFEPLDGHVFRTARQVYTLHAVAGPGAGAICRGDDGRLWACGLQARSALIGLIRDARVVCVAISPPVAGGGSATPGATFSCSADGRDLAQTMAAAGWVRPAGGSDLALVEAVNSARQARRGLWDGAWQFVRAGVPAATGESRAGESKAGESKAGESKAGKPPAGKP